MEAIVPILITWLVIAVSLLIISKIPIGVEIDSFGKALMSAAVFGILNALLTPLLSSLPAKVLTLGLFSLSFVVNAVVFGLAAWLVQGFRLRWGVWSALLGAMALGFVNSIILHVLSTLV